MSACIEVAVRLAVALNVTGASPLGPTPVLRTPQPVGTATGEELRRRGEATLGDALRRVVFTEVIVPVLTIVSP